MQFVVELYLSFALVARGVSPSFFPRLRLSLLTFLSFLSSFLSFFLLLLLPKNNNLRLDSHSMLLLHVETIEREKEEEIERKTGKVNVLLLLPIDNG